MNFVLEPRQMPTVTTNTKWYCASSVQVQEWNTRSACSVPCRTNADSLFYCPVRHVCFEWLVPTQDRHKYNTCHSLFCPGNTNHHTNLGFNSVCIRFVFQGQNKACDVLYTQCVHIQDSIHAAQHASTDFCIDWSYWPCTVQGIYSPNLPNILCGHFSILEAWKIFLIFWKICISFSFYFS